LDAVMPNAKFHSPKCIMVRRSWLIFNRRKKTMSKILNVQFDIESKQYAITQIPVELREHTEFLKQMFKWDFESIELIMDDEDAE